MTPQQIEKLLLLEQTGELSSKQRQRLQEALATSAAARQQREQWQKMAALLPPPAWQLAPAPEAAARIAARLQATEAATAPIRRPYALHPAWAAAATAGGHGREVARLAAAAGCRTHLSWDS